MKKDWNKETHPDWIPESSGYSSENIRKNLRVIQRAAAERGARWMRKKLGK